MDGSIFKIYSFAVSFAGKKKTKWGLTRLQLFQRMDFIEFIRLAFARWAKTIWTHYIDTKVHLDFSSARISLPDESYHAERNSPCKMNGFIYSDCHRGGSFLRCEKDGSRHTQLHVAIKKIQICHSRYSRMNDITSMIFILFRTSTTKSSMKN